MALADDAAVFLFLADYVASESSGKMNVIGLGYQTTMVMVPGNHTPLSGLGVVVEVPSSYVGQSATLAVTLHDVASGELVVADVGEGEKLAVRTQQVVTFNQPRVEDQDLPPEMPCRAQLAINFPNGIPLETGHVYEWRAEVDRQIRATTRFWVRGRFVGVGPISDVPVP